ncbi:MAG: hypothetical protein ACRC7R_08390 [Sarcina sp.]
MFFEVSIVLTIIVTIILFSRGMVEVQMMGKKQKEKRKLKSKKLSTPMLLLKFKFSKKQNKLNELCETKHKNWNNSIPTCTIYTRKELREFRNSCKERM